MKPKLPRCEGMCLRPLYLGSIERCSHRGRYKTPEGIHLCGKHLKEARAFSKNPMDLVTKQKVDRHALYYSGVIKLIKEAI